MPFWDVVRLICLAYLVVAFLGIIYWISGDVLRDDRRSAVNKALWLVALLVMPFLTPVVYLVLNGGGLSARLIEREAIRDYSGYSDSSTRPPTDDLMAVRTIVA